MTELFEKLKEIIDLKDVLKVVGGMIISMISIYFSLIGKRPYVVLTGQKCKSIPDTDRLQISLNVKNVPSFFGVHYERGKLSVKYAYIFDDKTNTHTTVYWNSNGEFLEGCTLEPNEIMELCILMREQGSQYYYVPSKDNSCGRYLPPRQTYDYAEHVFEVVIVDTQDRNYKLHFRVTHKNGGFQIKLKKTLHLRRIVFRSGVEEIRRSFSSFDE